MTHPHRHNLGFLLSAALAAASCAGGHSKALAQLPQMHAGLAGQLRLFQPRVVAGRIIAIGANTGQNMSSSSTGSGRRERLSIRLTDGVPTVSYELMTPNEQISFEIIDGDRVTLRRQSSTQKGTNLTEFYQVPGRPIVVLSGSADASQKTEAPTLWHLSLAEPELFQRQIVPLLEMMRPGWPVGKLADDIEQGLCQAEVVSAPPEQELWQQWVSELGNKRFARRQAADRRLRASGEKVLPFLQGLDHKRLDFEQSRRVREIIRAITPEAGEDVPQQAVARMLDDPRVWYALLSRDDPTKRRRAAEQLARVLKGPIDFDPGASADVRRTQREALAEGINQAAAKPDETTSETAEK